MSVTYIDKPEIICVKGRPQLAFLVEVGDERVLGDSIEKTNKIIENIDFVGRIDVRPSQDEARRFRVHPGICLYFSVPEGEDPLGGETYRFAKQVIGEIRRQLPH